jgi:hydroxyacylglutathione hydrolase
MTMRPDTDTDTEGIPPASTREAEDARAATSHAVGERYFRAVAARDVEAAVACWRPGGREVVHGILDEPAPQGVRTFLGGVFAALPDAQTAVLSITADGNRCAVRWQITGTFAGTPFLGYHPTGARLHLQGCDLLQIAGGLIVRNDAFTDGMSFAAQAGLLPPTGSAADRAIKRAANLRPRVAARLRSSRVEQITDGLWLLRGGFPGRIMNVYLLRDDDGIAVFNTGIRPMAAAIATAAARLGGITKVILGHSHADHRGAAALLDAPVWCHHDERADAEGDGGARYFDYVRLGYPSRLVMPRLMRSWDAGPVAVAGTLSESDTVAGFEVVHLPGHAPGMIGLWREHDRVAVVSDCLYAIDAATGRKGDGRPRLPHPAYTADAEQARFSVLKLAALDPTIACPGHGDPLTHDIAGRLTAAADNRGER